MPRGFAVMVFEPILAPVARSTLRQQAYAARRMAEHVRARLRASVIAAAAIAAAGITLLALIVVSARYPLPILIGARRGSLFAGLTISVALATAAVASEASSRHPRLAMPRT